MTVTRTMTEAAFLQLRLDDSDTRTVTSWVRRADGTYTESVYRSGTIAPRRCPGVVIDLDALFER